VLVVAWGSWDACELEVVGPAWLFPYILWTRRLIHLCDAQSPRGPGLGGALLGLGVLDVYVPSPDLTVTRSHCGLSASYLRPRADLLCVWLVCAGQLE
jgi:hypothetical protein